MHLVRLSTGSVLGIALMVTIIGCPKPEIVVTLEPQNSEVVLEHAIQFSATSTDPDDTIFSFDTDAPEFVLVKPDGLVKGIQLGSATITAKGNHSGVIGSTKISIVPPEDLSDELPSREEAMAISETEDLVERSSTGISIAIGAETRQEGSRVFHDLYLPGAAETDEPGKAKIPFLDFEYVIPRDALTKSAAQFDVEVTKQDVQTYTGVVPYPAQPPAWLDDLPSVVDGQKQDVETTPPARPGFAFDEESYDNAKPYPGKDYDMETYTMGDLDVVRVRVYPAQYKGASKTLEVAQAMEVKVDFGGGAEVLAPPILGDYSGVTPLDVAGKVLLPSRFANGNSIRLIGHADIAVDIPFPDFETIQDEYFQLLILTRPDLYDEAYRLAAHRQAEGWRVYLGNLASGDWEYVLETVQYLWDHNVIEYSGVTFHPMRALLLFGDTELIETCPGMYYRGFPRPSDPAESVSIVGTDNRYATLEGTDYIPDFLVGRISVDDIVEAEAAVSKIIRYEGQIGGVPPHNMAVYSYFQEEPSIWRDIDGDVTFLTGNTAVTGDGTNFEDNVFYPSLFADYIRIRGGYDDYDKWSQVDYVVSERRLILTAPFGGPSDVTGAAEVGFLDGRDNWEFVKGAERVRQWMLDRGNIVHFGYTRSRGPVPQRAFDGSTLPDDLLTYFWDCTTADIQDRWRQGHDGIVLHTDHGARSGWINPHFRNGDVVSRSSPLLGFDPIVINLNCSSGWFDNETDMRAWGDGTDRLDTDTNSECLSETLLRQPNGGAVAVIAAMRGSDAGRNDKLLDGIFGAFYADYEEGTMAGRASHDVATRLGDAFWAAKMHQMPYMGSDTYMQYNMEIYHLFGDPLMQLNLPQPPR